MLYLSNQKKTEYVIVLRKQHSTSEATAAQELAKYLLAITDVEFPIVTDDTAPAQYEIVVGYADRPGCAPREDLGTDGFHIKTDDSRLLILGSEVRGALYGVYTFLEKYCGCRFFTTNCEKVPKAENALLIDTTIDDVQIPVFEYRNVYWHALEEDEMLCAKLKNNGGMGHNITDKVGGAIHYNGAFCHTIEHLAETGNFWDMPCLSDENVYQTALKNVKADLRAFPDKKIISVSQVDGNNGECSCEKCRKVYEEEKSHMGTMLRFVNRIQEDIKEEFPDVTVDTLAYRFTRKPPAVTRPHKDVIIRLCNIECCFRHPLEAMCYGHDEEFDSFPDNLKQWNEICNHLYIWDYTTNFSNMPTIFPNFDSLKPNMRYFVENGVKGVFSQGNISSDNGEFGELRSYLLTKLQWNPYMSDSEYRSHIADFCQGYYGEGGKYIEEFINLFQYCSEDAHMTIYFEDPTNVISMPGYKDRLAGCFAFYDKASKLFDEAEAAAWAAENRQAYANIRRSRTCLIDFNHFALKAAKEQAATQEAKDALDRAIIDNNRQLYSLMREYGVNVNREFHHLDFSLIPDLREDVHKW